MSLYNDLTDVLTPYANKIKEVNESLGEKVPYPKESGTVAYPSEDSNLVIHPDGSVGYGTKTPIPSLPVLNLYGDMTGITKENRVNLKYAYVDDDNHEQFTGWLDAKLQGDSSLLYPKKNYTFRFYHDPSYRRKDKINFFEMTKQSKWVVKANYMDHSHARNIVSARLWADIVHSRNTAPPELLTGSPNNGAINGYPIKIYLNGQYLGLYTLNIPKDDFTFGMDEKNPLHCCAYGQANNNGDTTTTAGSVLSNEFRLADTIGWECEVPGSYTNDTRAGLVALINFVMTSTDEEFKDGLDAYLDVESMLDYYAFCYFIGASDSLAQNMILLTYDGGTKWYCSAYDLDSTFGIYYNGGRFYPYNMACPEDYQDTNSLLWQRVEANFGTELYERYTSLRETVLSVDYVTRAFRQFMGLISDADYEEDVIRWPQTPQKNVDHFEQITTWISQRAPYVDARIAEIAGEYEAAVVTYNLSNVVSSNSASETAIGGSYTTTLSTYGGAPLSSVSVIMDFVDVTSSVYSNGVINISNVTGNIVINASASDGTLLYALPSAFTGNGSSAYIDTNVMLFDTNKDFSIVYTVRNTSGSAGSGKLFTCHNWMVVEQGSTSKRDVGLIIDGYASCKYEGNSFYTYINPNQTAKVVLTHVGGSNVLTRRRVASNGESQNNQMTGTYPFVSRNRTVVIGCDRSEYNETPNSFLSSNVTLDDFKIYGRVLRNEEIESYVTF